MNKLRSLSISQTSSAFVGFLVYLVAGSGYSSAAIAMIIAIGFMIFMKAMHPPAVSTALSFAFREADAGNLMLFLMALVLLIILILLQRVSLWIIKKESVKRRDKIQ